MPPEFRARFCILGYAPSLEPGSSTAPIAVLLITVGLEGSTSLFVHPSLSDVIKPAQLGFVESLIHDFIGRAQEDGDDLFRQLCSLASGPLVAIATGDDPDENSTVLELQRTFVKL